MKKTKLNTAHRKLNGKMVEFVGWELPVQFSGLIPEHMAVRTAAGIFDVSHMGEILVKGREALAAVQHVISNDASKLVPGKIVYTALMKENGAFIDDMLVYMVSETEYFLVVNASNIEKDFNWITSHTGRFDVTVTNQSDLYSQIALQGPLSQEILQGITNVDLAAMAYYHFAFGEVLGVKALVSRTGYTGEDGFEIYFQGSEQQAEALFLKLHELGRDKGLLPCGLGSRDTLRLEAKMALYGNDIDEDHTVLEADLGWILKLQKGDFIGRDVLEKQKAGGLTRKLVGFEMREPGIARHGYPVFIDGQEAGVVTSGTHAPYLKKAIGLAYLPISRTATGSVFDVRIREKFVKAEVVPTPFYKRQK
jgi:aminomethyltransferase